MGIGHLPLAGDRGGVRFEIPRDGAAKIGRAGRELVVTVDLAVFRLHGNACVNEIGGKGRRVAGRPQYQFLLIHLNMSLTSLFGPNPDHVSSPVVCSSSTSRWVFS